jgi:hypothetical protein
VEIGAAGHFRGALHRAYFPAALRCGSMRPL